jgi:hypothetical protein
MNSDQAQSAVTISAMTVAGIFAYRKLVEPAPKTKSPPTSHFVVGFGVVFVSLAVAAQAAPQFGGMMAILVAVGDLLANGQAIANDIVNALGGSPPIVGGTPQRNAANIAAAAGISGQVSALTPNPPVALP